MGSACRMASQNGDPVNIAMNTPDPAQILCFKNPAAFRRWLAKNHATAPFVWLRYFKKGSGEQSVTYAEALDQALCYGWIDGQAKPYDGQSWLQRFTPRRPKSAWSRINTGHIERLDAAGLLTPAGEAQVALAKADGRWAAAYSSPKNATPPQDLLEALATDKKAQAFFSTLNKTNVYAIVYRLQTAKKPETREKRMREILAMLKRGEKLHPPAPK